MRDLVAIRKELEDGLPAARLAAESAVDHVRRMEKAITILGGDPTPKKKVKAKKPSVSGDTCAAVLEIVRRDGPLTADEIQQKLGGKSRSTVANALSVLREGLDVRRAGVVPGTNKALYATFNNGGPDA